MAGLTAEGLVIKRYTEILAEKRERAISRFLDLVPPGDRVDVSDSSTLGRLIALSIPGETDLWEAIQEVYDGQNPNAAVGIALDNIVALGGIERFGETRSTVQALFTGDIGTAISQGSVVRSSATGEDWVVIGGGVILDASRAQSAAMQVVAVTPDTDYTITFTTDSNTHSVTYHTDSVTTEQAILSGLLSEIQSTQPTLTADITDGLLWVRNNTVYQEGSWETTNNLAPVKLIKVGTLQAQNAGPIEQLPYTVTTIATPILGWDSVTNPTAAVVGRWRETDDELRLRFRNSKYQRAGNILEALYTALTSIADVREVKIYENDTDQYDENGIPPHSFMPVVLGGDGNIIAQNIWENKPLGIRSYGNTIVTIIDSQFFPHDIGFERPNPVPIYITITLTTTEEFPADGVSRIREELVSYFDSFRIGDDVIYSRLYTPINKVPGHQVDEMFVGTSANPDTMGNIVIPFNEIASISPANIIVNANGG